MGLEAQLKAVVNSPESYVKTLAQTVSALDERLNALIHQKSNDHLIKSIIDGKLEESSEKVRRLTSKIAYMEE